MNQGICLLSNIPLRKEPDGRSEMVSMLLFGESYEITAHKADWSMIRTTYDQYDCWISNKQISELHEPLKSLNVFSGFPYVTCSGDHGDHFILAGSSIPHIVNGSFEINNQTYTLKWSETENKSSIEEIARRYLNAPYLWGGRSPFGIDCSGLTQIVFKTAGIRLLRDAWQQAEQGNVVAFRETVESGDLAFFDNAEGKITHVGIMLTPDSIIHASGKVKIEKIDDYGIFNEEKKEYSHKLRFIKRIQQ